MQITSHFALLSTITILLLSSLLATFPVKAFSNFVLSTLPSCDAGSGQLTHKSTLKKKNLDQRCLISCYTPLLFLNVLPLFPLTCSSDLGREDAGSREAVHGPVGCGISGSVLAHLPKPHAWGVKPHFGWLRNSVWGALSVRCSQLKKKLPIALSSNCWHLCVLFPPAVPEGFHGFSTLSIPREEHSLDSSYSVASYFILWTLLETNSFSFKIIK